MNKEQALTKLKKSTTGIIFKKLSPELRDDKEVALAALKRSGYPLEFVSDRLKADATVVYQAIQNHPSVFQYASEELKNNASFIFQHLNGHRSFAVIYSYCSPQLQNDREFTLKFLKTNGFAYQFLCDDFKADKDMAFAALEGNSFSYSLFIRELKNDKDIIKAALKLPDVYAYLPIKLKQSEELALYAIKNFDAGEFNTHNVGKHLGANLKNSKGFFEKAIDINASLFIWASDEIKGNATLVKKALINLGHPPQHNTDDCKSIIAPLAIKNPYFLNFGPVELNNDRELILQILKRNSKHIQFASEEIRNMLGDKESNYVANLENVIRIEAQAEKLDNTLEHKGASKRKKI